MKIRLAIFILGWCLLNSCSKHEDLSNFNVINGATIKCKLKDKENLDLIRLYVDSDNNAFKTFYFFSGNKIKAEVNHVHGKLFGQELTYDSLTGNVKTKSRYIKIGRYPYWNELITYTENGKIDEKNSWFLRVISSQDTASVNESVDFKVNCIGSRFQDSNTKHYLIIGNFDIGYNLMNRKGLTVVPLKEGEAHARIKLISPGINTIRGYVFEKKVISDSSSALYKLFFEKDIFVLGSELIKVNSPKEYSLIDSVIKDY